MAIELLTNIDLEAQPNAPKHVVNIDWVQNFFAGRIKLPVRAASTSNLTAAHNAVNHTLTFAGALPAIDGVTLVVGDRVLVAGQTNPAHNGIYDVTQLTPGILARSDDFDHPTKIFNGVSVAVNDGDTYANETFRLACDEPVTRDTTPLNFTLTVPTTGSSTRGMDIDCNGTDDEWVFAHSLDSEDVVVQVWNRLTKAVVMCDIEITDADTVTVKFDIVPPNTARYRIVVTG